MTTTKWHEGHLVALDTETTGTNPHTDRIVTAALIHVPVGARPTSIQWIINAGVDVPAEAAEVHGWTTERLNTEVPAGKAVRRAKDRVLTMTVDAALFEIAGQVTTAIAAKAGLVVHNAAFDLTLLETELARVGIDTVASRLKGGITGVVDPMVIEKEYDPYRKQCYQAAGCNPEERSHECGGCRGGKYDCGGCGSTDRTLTSLCAHYGIRHTGAHDATGDALAAARLARKLGGLYRAAGSVALGRLGTLQAGWCRGQRDGLRAYFDRVGKDHDGMCPEWPVHVECAPAVLDGAA